MKLLFIHPRHNYLGSFIYYFHLLISLLSYFMESASSNPTLDCFHKNSFIYSSICSLRLHKFHKQFYMPKNLTNDEFDKYQSSSRCLPDSCKICLHTRKCDWILQIFFCTFPHRNCKASQNLAPTILVSTSSFNSSQTTHAEFHKICVDRRGQDCPSSPEPKKICQKGNRIALFYGVPNWKKLYKNTPIFGAI